MLQRDSDFERKGFPVDVFWMDIEHTQSYEYFVFNGRRFPEEQLNSMNAQIASHQRKFVVITDPHIKATD